MGRHLGGIEGVRICLIPLARFSCFDVVLLTLRWLCWVLYRDILAQTFMYRSLELTIREYDAQLE